MSSPVIGLHRAYSSMPDKADISASLIDRYDKDSGSVVLRGLESGFGIKLNLLDADKKPGTTEASIVISVDESAFSTRMSDLSDVDVSGAKTGQVLAFNGAQWTPITLTGGGSGGFEDVLFTVTNPNVGESLVFNGAEYVNQKISFDNLLDVPEIPSATSQLINDAGFITSSSSITGNASTATKLLSARSINGVLFDGSKNIVIADDTKLPLIGGRLSGYLTLHANPTLDFHAVTKQYVDNAQVDGGFF